MTRTVTLTQQQFDYLASLVEYDLVSLKVEHERLLNQRAYLRRGALSRSARAVEEMSDLLDVFSEEDR